MPWTEEQQYELVRKIAPSACGYDMGIESQAILPRCMYSCVPQISQSVFACPTPLLIRHHRCREQPRDILGQQAFPVLLGSGRLDRAACVGAERGPVFLSRTSRILAGPFTACCPNQRPRGQSLHQVLHHHPLSASTLSPSPLLHECRLRPAGSISRGSPR